MEPGFTNILLVEKQVLLDKLNYIKDLVEEEFLQGSNSEIYHKIKAICENKTCGRCKWTAIDPYDDGMRCIRAESDNCSDWVDNNNSCKYFEQKDFYWIKTCDMCPEQYDVYDKMGSKVAYVRERGGHLTVQVSDLGDPIIFEIDNINDKTVLDYKYEIENRIKKYSQSGEV